MPSHFCVRILPSELPLDAALCRVTAQLPSIHFGGDRSTIRQTPIKALSVKNTDFDFSHVEPTGMLRRVVKDDTSQQGLCLLDAEYFLEALAKVGIEIVHHQMDALRCSINLLEQILHESHEIGLGTMIGDHDRPPPSFWLDRHEQVASASAVILVILLRGRAWPDWQRRTRILEQLLALLVQTNDGFLRLEWTGIKVEQVVHTLPVFFGQCANAPHHLAPWLEAVFFSSRRIVSRLIEPISACFCAACSSNSRVQRLAPSGGSEQAKAVICASTSVSYSRGLPERVTSHTAYATPPSRYALRVRQMAVRPTPRISMIWASGIPRSRADKICARLTSRAWCKPLARYDSINSRSSSVRCSSVWRMAGSSSWGGHATV